MKSAPNASDGVWKPAVIRAAVTAMEVAENAMCHDPQQSFEHHSFRHSGWRSTVTCRRQS
jgi:hypothetical protein